jgi:hypothetical protein
MFESDKVAGGKKNETFDFVFDFVEKTKVFDFVSTGLMIWSRRDRPGDTRQAPSRRMSFRPIARPTDRAA